MFPTAIINSDRLNINIIYWHDIHISNGGNAEGWTYHFQKLSNGSRFSSRDFFNIKKPSFEMFFNVMSLIVFKI